MRIDDPKVEGLLDKLEKIVAEYDSADDRWNRSKWNEKFEDKLGCFSDRLKKLNGDDFDIMVESYDEYHDKYNDISEEEYVEALENNIKKIIERVWPEAPEDAKEEIATEAAEAATEDVENTDKDETDDADAETEDKTDEVVSEETEVEETESENEADDDGDDLEEFTKELEEYRKSH